MLKKNKFLFFDLKKNTKYVFTNNFLIFFCKDSISEEWLRKKIKNYSALKIMKNVFFKKSNKHRELGFLDFYSVCFFSQPKDVLDFAYFYIFMLKQEHKEPFFREVDFSKLPINYDTESLSFSLKAQVLGAVIDNIYLPLNVIIKYTNKISEIFLTLFGRFLIYFYKTAFISISRFFKKLQFLLN